MAHGRTFNGSTDRVTLDATPEFAAWSGVTWACLLYRNSTGNWHAVLFAQGSSNTLNIEIRETNIAYMEMGGSEQTLATARFGAAGWYLFGFDKAAGTTTGRFHVYNGTTWFHDNAAGTAPDPSTSVSGTMELGRWGGSGDWYDGDLAYVGLWSGVKFANDAAWESDSLTLTNWQAFTNKQFYTESLVGESVVNVNDESANNFDESSRSGTSVSTRDLPAWFILPAAGPTPEASPPVLVPPGYRSPMAFRFHPGPSAEEGSAVTWPWIEPFTYSNGTLTAANPSRWSTATGEFNGLPVDDSIRVVSNHLEPGANEWDMNLAVVELPDDNQYAKWDVTSGGTNFWYSFVGVRTSADGLDGYFVQYQWETDFSFALVRADDGVLTTLGSATVPNGVGTHTIEVRAVGNVISALFDGSVITSVTDSTYPTNRGSAIVLSAFGGTPSADNFEEGTSLDVAVPVTETGTGTDTATASASWPVTETGTGSDTATQSIAVPVTDSGVGTDTATVPAVSSDVTDTGTGTDTTTVSVSWSVTESGTGTDTATAVPTVAADETGTGTDTATTSAVVTVTESGTGDDTVGLIQDLTIEVTESGTGTDTATVTASWSVTEDGTGTDTATQTVSLSVTETGTGTDTTTVEAAWSVTDSAAGTDTTTASASVTVTEDGTGTETISQAQFVTDSGTGTDTGTVSASLSVTDTGTGTDTTTFPATITVTEDGTGTDSALVSASVVGELLTSGYSTLNQATYVTASISPDPNSLLLLGEFLSAATTAGTASISDSGGNTWTEEIHDLDGGRSAGIFTAQMGPTPGTITITIGSTGGDATHTGAGWSVIQVTNHDTADPSVQVKLVGGDGTSSTSGVEKTGTLDSAPASALNRVFAFWQIRVNEAQTPRANWTELSDDSGASPVSGFESQWRNDGTNEQTFGSTWATGSRFIGLAIEIRVASADQVVNVTETGAGTDTTTVAASVSVTESGTGTETATLQVTVTETGTGTDTATTTVVVTVTESGTGTDSTVVQQASDTETINVTEVIIVSIFNEGPTGGRTTLLQAASAGAAQASNRKVKLPGLDGSIRV